MGGAASYFENMTPAQKMYQWTFAVSIPQMHMYSHRELEIYGTVSSGDAEYDRALALEPVKMAGVTIARMLEWWKMGLRNEIVLLHPDKDAPVIFNIVRDVIQTWYNEASKNPSMPDIPLEHLQVMDDFAKAVYEIAKFHFAKDTSNLSFFDQMQVDPISPLGQLENHFKKVETAFSSAPYRSAFDDIVAIVNNQAKRNWRG